MRNRFVIGAIVDSGSKAQTNITGANTQTGGTKDADVVAHNHGITEPNQGQGHYHGIGGNDAGSGKGYAYHTNRNYDTINSYYSTTGITINSAGVSGTNQNLPPYYALAFIIRIS